MASLGRYEVLQEIGRGGEGVVFLAVDPTIDRKVAIKTLPIAEDPTGALRAKLQQEAKSTAKLNHPHIVTVYEFAQQDGLAYIVMEYVAGKSLAECFEQGESHDFATVHRYLMQAAQALDHAHSEGVIHRDIKPENLMIQNRGGLKVADFGIAKVLDDVSSARTKTGVIRGTPYYMSPEQIDLKGLSGRSDQFALAVVAYQWLCGTRPFEGESWTELLTKILTHDPPPVSKYRESLGEGVTLVLLKALAKDPNNRWDSCTEFIHELGIALGTVAPDARNTNITKTLQVRTPAGIPAPGTTGASKFPSGQQAFPTVSGNAQQPVSAVTGTVEPAPKTSKPWLWIGIAASGLIALAAVLLTRGGGNPVPQPQTPAQPVVQQEQQQKPPQNPVEITKPQERKEVAATPARTRKAEPPTPSVAKKETPPAAPPQQQVVAQAPPPVPAPVVTEPEPVPAAPAGRYFGPPEGRFSWTGSLGPGQNLVLTASHPSSGSLQGRGLPPQLDVSVTVDPPTIQVLGQPAAGNGYKLTLKNAGSSEVPSIVIRWRERKK